MNALIRALGALAILLALAIAPAAATAAPAAGSLSGSAPQAVCSNPITLSVTGGVDDNFVLNPLPAELAAPSPALLAWMDSIWGTRVNPFFDRPFKDRVFGHTLQLGTPPNLDVISAHLTIRLRAYTSLTSNDSIGFYDPATNTTVWGTSLAAESGTNWDPGTTSTLVLPLPLVVLGTLTDGALDVVIEDDTYVDYMRLEVTVCWCLPGAVLLGGIADNFVLPPEPRVLSPGLNQYIAIRRVLGVRDFDQSQSDYWFGHTFSNLYPLGEPRPICGATLEIHVKPDSGYPQNDTMTLTFVGPNGVELETPAPAWWSYFGTTQGFPSLGAGNWAPGNPDAVITLDLASLPNGGANILPLMQMYNWLDVVVQDDTMVDHVKLTFTK